MNNDCIIQKIFSYYEDYGDKDYIGEVITQNEHMIQSAMLAEKDNQSKEVILACLFHDIGHLIQLECDKTKKMGKYGIKNHEKIGRQFLEDCKVPYPIPNLVENHVKAKRYLTYKYIDYILSLSDASKKTLYMQGGPMKVSEAEVFESSQLFDISIKMRDYDDKAKVKGVKINNFDYYKDMLKQVLTK